MEAFCESYAAAVGLAVTHVQILPAFIGHTFVISKNGAVTRVLPAPQGQTEALLHGFMALELQDRLLDVNWENVRASPDEALNFSFAVNEFVDLSITYSNGVEVAATITNPDGLQSYLRGAGHAATP